MTKTFIISEIGNNHNGSITRALEMIDLSKKMGADAVKFQLRDVENMYRKNNENEDLGTEYILDLLGKYELKNEDHKIIREYCKKINIEYICSPWDLNSLKYLDSFNLNQIKVASADMTNLPLINEIIKRKKKNNFIYWYEQ